MKALIFLFVQFIAVNALGQKKHEAFDSLFMSHQRNDNFGGAILVAEQDSIIFQKAMGWGDYGSKETLKVTTPIPLASLTKSFTSTAIMILKQEKKINYDDFVKKYIPDFPYDDITIRHLLYHTAGFKRLENDFGTKGETFDHHEILKYIIKEKPKLSFKPGTSFQYSNTGYAILACIIEKVSELRYSKFIEQHIFEPLGMTNSFVIEKTTENKKRAITYDKKWKVEEKHLDSYTGAIGICSTIGDLLKFDKALYTDLLVTQDILTEGFRNGKLNDNTMVKYAFGWRHWKGNENQLFNRGDWWGVATIMFRDLVKRQTIIILANKDIDLDSSVLVEEAIKILNRTGD